MLLHIFHSQEERREFGGSYFIEFQYCRLAQGTKPEKIVSADTVEHWKNDSLYLYGDDDNEFISRYGSIFTGGIYANGKSGVVDLCGINYYSREQTERIIKEIQKKPLPDAQVLLHWLQKAKENAGFYVLGL